MSITDCVVPDLFQVADKIALRPKRKTRIMPITHKTAINALRRSFIFPSCHPCLLCIIPMNDYTIIERNVKPGRGKTEKEFMGSAKNV